jgi:hemerythrin-like domain-containing protein
MHDFNRLNETDPLKRMVEKESTQEEFSPMDPPEAFNPPNLDKVEYADMHPYLQMLMDEHRAAVEVLNTFETVLLDIRQNGVSREADKQLRDFFEYFDNHIVGHNRKEEKALFPLLRRRLLESGEHGRGAEAVTGVDVLEDDHAEALQLAAVVFNFFALASRLPDAASRAVVMDAALEQGKSLVELLKLHIFREDNVVFVQAHRLIDKTELDAMLLENRQLLL